jgi:riboflavin kinase / FMN adenylyltransferase
MRILHSLAGAEISEDTSITLGVFDGVHIGHQRLLKRVITIARERSLQSLAITFDPHPEAVLTKSGGPPLLTSVEEKLALFSELGVKNAVVLPFDRALANITARDFVSKILVKKLRARYIVAGPESHFGKGARGNPQLLERMGDELDFGFEVAPEVLLDGTPVSSTAIREALAAGELARATKMLGRPYRISGTVISGAGRGRDLGFPTANLPIPLKKALPPDGVYACIASLNEAPGQFDWNVVNSPDGNVALVYIGSRPTFGGGERVIEAHICEEDLQLYNQELALYFISRLRGDIAFDTPEALIAQMVEDARQAFEVIGDFYSSQ